MPKKSVKTLEMKLYPGVDARKQLETSLNTQRWVWNNALAALKGFELFTAYHKEDSRYYPCCPLPWGYRWGHVDKLSDWRDSAIINSLSKKDRKFIPLPLPHETVPFIGATSGKSTQCPLLQSIFDSELKLKNPKKETLTEKLESGKAIARWITPTLYLDKPELHKAIEAKFNEATGKFRSRDSALRAMFAHNVQHKLKESGVAAKLTQSTVTRLCDSWTRYKAGKSAAPRFKSVHDFTTITNNQDSQCKVVGDFLHLPKMLPIRCKGLGKRWPKGLTKVNSYHIKKMPSGWYIYLVGEIESEQLKPSTLTAGFDAGVVHILNDDIGNHIDIPSPLERNAKKLAFLQKKLARQVRGSAGYNQTQLKIAKVHETTKRERKAWHHKLTTFAVRKYESIAIEDLNLKGMVKGCAPKVNEDGTGYEKNNQAAKTTLSRKLLDAGIGGMYTMLEGKAKVTGRTIVRVSPNYTSQTCNNCGAVSKKNRLSQSEFKCVHCGHTDNADTNAAKNIKLKAFG